jgi:hypothetical protein
MNETFFGGISNKSFVKKQIGKLPPIVPLANKDNIKIITEFLIATQQRTKNRTNEIACAVKEKAYHGLMIRGPVGCGKMTLIDYCVDQVGFKSIKHDTDYETDEIFNDMLISLRASIDKTVVIFRDFDNSFKLAQKTAFFKYITKRTLPFILTSSTMTVGTVRSVPKCILRIDYEQPSMKSIVSELYNPIISRNLLEKIIRDSNYDIRYAKSIIETALTEQSNSQSNPQITKIPKKLTISSNLVLTKDIELDTFECIKYCTGEHSWDEKLAYASVYTGLTVFQNYPSIIGHSSKGKSKDDKNLELMSNIVDYCCMSEFVCESEELELLLGTIIPLELINNAIKNMDTSKDMSLIYPSSNISVIKEESAPFRTIETESMMLKILELKYFKNNKFIGDYEEFSKEVRSLIYPIRSCKLISENTCLMRYVKKVKSEESKK